MAIIKTELDNKLEKINSKYRDVEMKKRFLKELKPEDIESNENLKCLYQKWLLRYYLE